jgi:hypothetical protein
MSIRELLDAVFPTAQTSTAPATPVAPVLPGDDSEEEAHASAACRRRGGCSARVLSPAPSGA